ncbi:MAG TPA: hypothetical protein VFE62_02540, partial [Gemmataceae bacterium]|nr:hypothetical protein [Gemmataceae bacterium]
WVMQRCDQMAESVVQEAKLDDAGRVRRLYRKAYGREATDKEVAKSLALVQEVERVMQPREAKAERRRLAAWSSLCQVIVSANEFIYIQ